MNSTSRDTYVNPVAFGTVTGDAGLPVATLPTEILCSNIFSYLGAGELGRVSQVCRGFNVLSRTVWQMRAREIRRACAELLPSFGSTSPGPNPSQAEATIFLDRTVQRVREIQNSLPEDLRSQFSADDLVCKVDPRYMQEFLQKAYDHSLRTVFVELAHVPAGTSPEKSVRLIREWLKTAEAGEIQELRRENCELFCLPRELGQLTALQGLCLRGNQLASLPPEIGQLTALRTLFLSGNQLASLPPEIGQLTALRTLFLIGNQLESLPREIGQLRALQRLYLDFNHLKVLPPEIKRLTALKDLKLGFNQPASPPPEIGRLTAPRYVHQGDHRLGLPRPEIDAINARPVYNLCPVPAAIFATT